MSKLELISFISDESGINNIYIADNIAGSPKPITNVLTGITQLNWVSNNQITLSLETISFLSIQGSEDLNSNLVHPTSARSPPFRLS